ncbi:MAG: hypothetical protein INQ03_23385 [Candidatus Heimdallarchaeota archaeon]|nr:hypothetical protein [Candidatus Heimdallarchaeota archaeon]
MDNFDSSQKVDIIKAYLISIAKFDGKVTEEEQRLINKVAADINEYFELLANIQQKSEISSLDRANLFKARLNVISTAVKTIREDFRATKDEKELFKAIQDFLPELPR